MSLFHAADRISPGLDRQAAGIRLLPFLYGLTLFVSALLLFSIQPMFAKMVLPKLGGAPAVWSVAMVFFQTTLLAGYAYAHVLMVRAINFQLRAGRRCLLRPNATTIFLPNRDGSLRRRIGKFQLHFDWFSRLEKDLGILANLIGCSLELLLALAAFINCSTCSLGSTTGRMPFLKQLLKKISA